jgi:hypothetical protein
LSAQFSASYPFTFISWKKLLDADRPGPGHSEAETVVAIGHDVHGSSGDGLASAGFTHVGSNYSLCFADPRGLATADSAATRDPSRVTQLTFPRSTFVSLVCTFDAVFIFLAIVR